MKPLNFSDEFQQYLKANDGVTAVVLYLPQHELGITMTLHPADMELMTKDAQAFQERFMAPAIAQLSQELEARK